MEQKKIQKVVIVGGGTAGWLVACSLASRYSKGDTALLNIVLIESGNIPTLGVGEGTWPSMKSTLKKIGLSEREFINSCDASFKQGSKFIDWSQGNGESYYHPFQAPIVNFSTGPLANTSTSNINASYTELMCPQVLLEKTHRAPKLLATSDYSFVVNYGYHLDANKFSLLLSDHGEKKLGVKRVIDTVVGISNDTFGYISSIKTEKNGEISGDLFVDCSGFSSVLMKKHYKIPLVCKKGVLFNDSAIAVQVPYSRVDGDIASYTISTAQKCGWIWDIGLPSRRGVGYTYASKYCTDEQARQELEHYIKKTVSTEQFELLEYKKIKFDPGHLEKFWYKNCLAVGVSSGFIEPLEASALVMVEMAANMLTDNFPTTFYAMDILADKYNERFLHHWDHIIEFLKLHYVLSVRDSSDYWRDNRRKETIPPKLLSKMIYWKQFPPSRYDDIDLQELFTPESYQYVLYGMGYKEMGLGLRSLDENTQLKEIGEGVQIAKQLAKSLPTNRELLTALKLKC